jgi:cytochrome b561
MKRYHPLLVSLHWLLAILILFSLFAGSNILADMSNDNPEKIAILKVHIISGLVILVLMLLRLFVRIKTGKPEAIDTGDVFINKTGKYIHIFKYILVFLIVGSGLGIAILSGLSDIVFFGSGEALPETFDDLLPRIVHGILTKILIVTIALHFLATIWHQFIRKENVFSRMWFGRR